MTRTVVDVVAAVIERADGSFLLASRPPGKVYAGYWEFPGGKVEPAEAPVDALRRELREELGIEAEGIFPWITREYSYEHARVRLHFHRVVRWVGEPSPREGQSLCWQSPGHATVSPMLPANTQILKALRLPQRMGITNAWECGCEQALHRLKTALARGLRLVQIREARLEAPVREEFAARVMEMVWQVGGTVLVNSEGPVMVMEHAGVHLSSGHLMALQSRPDVEWCGASCHNLQEMERARALELDFVLLGAVLATPSHPGAPILGWEGFAALVHGFPMPVFAIGGMHEGHLDEARRAGGHGIAMLRAAWQPGAG